MSETVEEIHAKVLRIEMAKFLEEHQEEIVKRAQATLERLMKEVTEEAAGAGNDSKVP